VEAGVQSSQQVQLEKSSIDRLEAQGGLRGIYLSEIISDTIYLCRELGESFLWVDQLCIVQDDARSKHGQIKAMDKIYRSAICTVIAALEWPDSCGLPGVQGRPRKPSVWTLNRKPKIEEGGICQNGVDAVVNPSA
jgi:hypothetical protein